MRRPWLLLASLAWLGCGPQPQAPGNGVRVVSLTPEASRFVVALGAAERLVGIDGASGVLPRLASLPRVDLAGAPALEPDLVLLAALPAAGEPALAELAAGGADVVEFAPHDLSDAIALVRDVGARIAGPEAALRFERRLSRPLAAIGGESHGRPRPRVVAVVSLDPLRIAGGHSFETDLIEIAGGTSVTHPGEEHRVVLRAEARSELAPDLVLFVPEASAGSGDEARLRSAFPGVEIATLRIEPGFWIDAPADPARRLRIRIDALSRRLTQGRSAQNPARAGASAAARPSPRTRRRGGRSARAR